MAYFVVVATDKPGSGEVRAAHRPAHRARLRDHDHPVAVRVGGPTLDSATGEMNGTMLVIESESVEAVQAFLADDPYMLAGLYKGIDVRPFMWGLGGPGSN